MKINILSIIFLFILTHCSTKIETNDEISARSLYADDIIEVEVEKVYVGTFNSEIISNGKLTAVCKATLQFESINEIQHIYTKNGNRVVKGEKIAELNSEKFRLQVKQAEMQLKMAEIRMKDFLMGYTINPKDTSEIPPLVLKNAKLKSGYDEALLAVEEANLNLKNTVLYAPIDGVVANLTAKQHNYPHTDKAFCTIIADSRFEIDFYVLESEWPHLKKGAKVSVSTFMNDSVALLGEITEINPVIETNGLIDIKATISNSNNTLLEGMNVKISIQRAIENVISVPKNAIVRRQNKDVVFTYKNGVSKWRYVTIGSENSEKCIVVSGLTPNDTLIVSNNLNLANDTKVVIKQNLLK